MHIYHTRLFNARSCSDTLHRWQRHGQLLWARESCLPIQTGNLDARHRYHRSPICMAKPSKKGPETTVKIFCASCKQYLYKYRKGGKGGLQKCFVERITEDETGGKLECPNCGVQFARSAMIRGRPANKIVGGKVFFQK